MNDFKEESPPYIYKAVVNDIPVTCVKLAQDIKKEISKINDEDVNGEVEEDMFSSDESLFKKNEMTKVANQTGHETVNSWIECHLFSAKVDAVAIDCEWLASWFRYQYLSSENETNCIPPSNSNDELNTQIKLCS